MYLSHLRDVTTQQQGSNVSETRNATVNEVDMLQGTE
jgi:hypothetical protein